MDAILPDNTSFFSLEDLPSEEWKEIPNYSRYRVSNMGRVKRIEYERKGKLYIPSQQKKIDSTYHYDEMILKPVLCNNKKSSKRYYKVSLTDDNGNARRHSIHRLVACAFIENPMNYPEVHHVKGNSFDNRAEKLEWTSTATHAGDPIRREKLSKNKGKGKGRKHTEEQRAKISQSLYKFYETGKKVILFDGKVYNSAKSVAEIIGYSPASVTHWLNGTTRIPPQFENMGLQYIRVDEIENNNCMVS